MTREEAQERIRTRQLARLGALFAGFAHEIRNPLSTVGLNLQLVQEDFGDSDTPRDRRIRKRLEVVETEVKRLQVILEEFLRFVRVPTLNRRPVDVNRLLQELTDFVQPETSSRGVSLRCFLDPSIDQADLDPDQFRGVIVNLLRNALDACEPGDQIMLASRRSGDELIVQVTDTGAGMTPEVAQQAFTPYFSTKKSGTGLGLPTVRRLIELHSGTVQLDSEPGRGTQFTIRVPRAMAPADRQERPE